HGNVEKVRLDATMTQNVVTYTVEILTENPDLTLRPYLTANVQFEVAKRENVMVVPNAALRWMPTSAEQVSPDSREIMNELSSARPGMRGGAGGGRPGGERAAGSGPTTRPGGEGRGRREGGGGGEYRRGMVWVQDGAFVKPIRVRAGMTDGANTEVASDDLKEGMHVITGEVRPDQPQVAGAAASGDARNPFVPQMPRRGGGGGGRGRGGGGGGR